MNQSGKVALGGIVTALCLVLMFLTGPLRFGTYALPAIAGLLLVIIVIELGSRWAWIVFVTVSILSFFFTSDMEAVILFIVFFGYYPILKSNLERIHSKVLQVVLKLAVFNLAMICSFFIGMAVFKVPQSAFTFLGVYLPWLLLLFGNVVFLVYDYALSGMISMYVYRFHHIIKKMMHL